MGQRGAAANLYDRRLHLGDHALALSHRFSIATRDMELLLEGGGLLVPQKQPLFGVILLFVLLPSRACRARHLRLALRSRFDFCEPRMLSRLLGELLKAAQDELEVLVELDEHRSLPLGSILARNVVLQAEHQLASLARNVAGVLQEHSQLTWVGALLSGGEVREQRGEDAVVPRDDADVAHQPIQASRAHGREALCSCALTAPQMAKRACVTKNTAHTTNPLFRNWGSIFGRPR
jgi:hypothetical protein